MSLAEGHLPSPRALCVIGSFWTRSGPSTEAELRAQMRPGVSGLFLLLLFLSAIKNVAGDPVAVNVGTAGRAHRWGGSGSAADAESPQRQPSAQEREKEGGMSSEFAGNSYYAGTLQYCFLLSRRFRD